MMKRFSLLHRAQGDRVNVFVLGVGAHVCLFIGMLWGINVSEPRITSIAY